MFRKTNIPYPLIRTCTCAYQQVRNISFSENFVHILNQWSLYRIFEKFDVPGITEILHSLLRTIGLDVRFLICCRFSVYIHCIIQMPDSSNWNSKMIFIIRFPVSEILNEEITVSGSQKDIGKAHLHQPMKCCVFY